MKPEYKKGTKKQIELRKTIDEINRNQSLQFELIAIVAKEKRYEYECLIKEGFTPAEALHLVK